MKLNLQCPYNNLSLGQISYGITNALLGENVDLSIFPIHNQIDISAYDKASEFFKQKVSQGITFGPERFDISAPTLRIWHIMGSYERVSNPSFLVTFLETDSITQSERNILNSYNKIFVTSNFTKSVFEENGVTVPVVYVPMGYDETHFFNLNKKYYDPGIITFLINGKYEPLRKNHDIAIKGWIKKFGGDMSKRLHLMITNQFLKPEDMNNVYGQLFGGQRPPPNVVVIPFLQQNSLVNDAYNCADVVIDLGNEALGLPSLICNGLGKFSVSLNVGGPKDWLPATNSIKLEPKTMKPAHDGVFFVQGQPYNQGNFFVPDENEYLAALDTIVNKIKAGENNVVGRELQKTYCYSNGIKTILKEIYGN